MIIHQPGVWSLAIFLRFWTTSALGRRRSTRAMAVETCDKMLTLLHCSRVKGT